MTAIPEAGVITVDDAPSISYVEWVRQIVENVDSQIEGIHNELYKASQGDTGKVLAIYNYLNEVRDKISLARATITEIVDDPHELDVVSFRYSGPGETLRKINKLIETVRELELELKAGEFDYYRTVAEMLTDVKEQQAPFESYGALPHIIQITKKIEAIETELKRQVQWSCREIGPLAAEDPDAPPPEPTFDIESLNQICLIVDVLGVNFRKDLMGRFSQIQLIPYEKFFKYGTQYCTLDHLERRCLWFKKLLMTVDNRVSCIFPPNYRLSVHLFSEFVRRTKQHLGDVLDEMERDESIDQTAHVAVLLKALKGVLAFEAEMKASFAVHLHSDDDEEPVDSIDIHDSIAEAFDPYLGAYVQLERQNLETLMTNLVKVEESGAVGEEGPQKPTDAFVSSRKMFEYIKGSLKRCTQFSTGLTYLSLSKEFRVCLAHYANSLKCRCPSPVSMKDGKVPIYDLQKDGELACCKIVITAEYCIDTIPPLEAMMKKHIHPSYEDQVNFSDQTDAFMDLVSYTMSILCTGICERMDPALKDLKKINWNNVDTVGDSSPYVKGMLSVINGVVPRIRSVISGIYYMNFCTTLVGRLFEVYLATLHKLRRVSKTGAGQLLLDVSNIKEFLHKMPTLRTPEGQTPVVISKTYKAYVDKRASYVENILKIVCTDDDKMEEMFAILLPESDNSELELIQSMKSGKSFIPLPNALDKVGDHIKDKLESNVVGRAAKEAVGEVKGAAKDLGKGIKSAFGALFGEDDESKQSSRRGEPTSSAVKPKKPSDGKTGSVTSLLFG